MAGGKSAVMKSREGVEDNYEEGARSINRLRPTKKDVVIGVSASGMTQFVRGALTRARRAGSKIIFVTCDPRTELQMFVDLTIAPAVGPEVIAGSTRLKAGTATKIVLNMLTTASMIRIGKTYGNLMVDVQMGSEKLRDRARRIITIVTGLGYEEAGELLSRAHWNVKAAIVMQKTGLPYTRALAKLRKAHDFVRDAIGEDVEGRLKEVLETLSAAQRGSRPAAALSSHNSAAACSCRNDAGSRGVTGPFTMLADHPRLARSGRNEHDAARVQHRRDAHGQTRSRYVRRASAEHRHVCAPRRGGQPGPVRDGVQGRSGLVEADMAVSAKPQDHQIDSTCARDRALVAPALGVRIGRHPVQKVNAPPRESSHGRTDAAA